MFYKIEQNQVHKIEDNDNIKYQQNEKWIGYLTIEDLNHWKKALEIEQSVIDECQEAQTHFRTNVDVYDTYSFGMIHILNVKNISEKRDRIGFYMKKNLFILIDIIDEDGSTRHIFEEGIVRFQKNLTLEKVIFAIYDLFLTDGALMLEETEKKIMHLEHAIVSGKLNNNLNKEIYGMRRHLSTVKIFYSQLEDIGSTIWENENYIFEDENLRYFKIFTEKAKRLANNTSLLSESLIHVREALDAAYNYNMNNTMKLFTVVSVIFLPLSLIAGWYGMNFTGMPELTWEYGYIMVIALCLVITVINLILFKRKKWM